MWHQRSTDTTEVLPTQLVAQRDVLIPHAVVVSALKIHQQEQTVLKERLSYKNCYIGKKNVYPQTEGLYSPVY